MPRTVFSTGHKPEGIFPMGGLCEKALVGIGTENHGIVGTILDIAGTLENTEMGFFPVCSIPSPAKLGDDQERDLQFVTDGFQLP